MKKLIIADVKSSNNHGKCIGHYFAVAQNYLDLYQSVCEVKVAGGPIFATQFRENNLFPLPYDFTSTKKWLLNKWKVLQNCRHLFRNTSIDDIIILQQSGLSTAIMGIALFASRKRNIYLIAYDTEAVTSYTKKLIYQFAKPKIKGVLCPNKSVADAYGISNCIVTDYIYPEDKKTIPIAYENKKYDIAIVGSIWPDKGVLETVKCLSKTQYRVLVAGKGDKTITKQIEDICKSAENIELHIGFVKDEDYCKYIRQARFCMLNYRGVYENRSSGVVLDILFNGTPIIGHRCKALKFVEDENIGILFNDLKDFDFSIIKDKTHYAALLNGIAQYLNKQKTYKQKVVNYLGLKQ